MTKIGRDPKDYADGKDLVPLKPLDPNNIFGFDGLARAMEFTSFNGRAVGEAVDVLHQMLTDKKCFKVLTLSAALTPAQQGILICELIEMGFDAVISTGAIMSHGFVEGLGGSHYKVPPGMKDEELYPLGYDRIYDTIAEEKKLDEAEKIVEIIMENNIKRRVWCSQFFTQELGKYLSRNTPPRSRSILKSAFLKKIPIFIPAFTDSELGLDFGIYRMRQGLKGKRKAIFDDFLDLDIYADIMLRAVKAGKSLGIFIIGGGVPRNWGQQIGPYLQIRGVRLGKKYGTQAGFLYGVRICTASVSEGGLSGCTFKEGISWGKFISPEKGGKLVEVQVDVTAVLPLIVLALMERMGLR